MNEAADYFGEDKSEDFEHARELRPEEYLSLTYTETEDFEYVEGNTEGAKSFRQKLNEMIAEGLSFPQMFATTEY